MAEPLALDSKFLVPPLYSWSAPKSPWGPREGWGSTEGPQALLAVLGSLRTPKRRWELLRPQGPQAAFRDPHKPLGAPGIRRRPQSQKPILSSSQVLLWISSFSFSHPMQSSGSGLRLDRTRMQRIALSSVRKVVAADLSAKMEVLPWFVPKQVLYLTKKELVVGLVCSGAGVDWCVVGLTDSWKDLQRIGQRESVRQGVVSIGPGVRTQGRSSESERPHCRTDAIGTCRTPQLVSLSPAKVMSCTITASWSTVLISPRKTDCSFARSSQGFFSS